MPDNRKLKVPKRIAGVKVPKEIRKAGNKALAIPVDPALRGPAIAALPAAAALAERRSESAPPRPARPGEPGTDPDRAGRLTDVVIAAALDGAKRLLDGIEAPAQPKADADADADAEPKPKAAARPKQPKADARPKKPKRASGAPAGAAAAPDA